MSLLPLNRLNDYVGVAAVLRGLLAGAVLAMAWTQLSSSTHLTWLTLRWLAGIGGPLIVWAMVRQILRFRNTQAATGVLFAGVILTFIGELTANLLFLELHQPL